MYICMSRIRKNTSNALSTKRKQANRLNFWFSRNWSHPTARLRRLSGSEFQTVGQAEAMVRTLQTMPPSLLINAWITEILTQCSCAVISSRPSNCINVYVEQHEAETNIHCNSKHCSVTWPSSNAVNKLRSLADGDRTVFKRPSSLR